MKKHLFKTMLAAVFLLIGSVSAWAEDVTFNFNGMSHAVSNESNAGDITVAEVITVDGVTMTISPKEEGVSTPNRWWDSNNGLQVRMYSGTLTLVAPNRTITKVVVNNGKWNSGNTFNGETATTGEWTGNCSEVVLAIAGNTQMNSIVVTLADIVTIDYKAQLLKILALADLLEESNLTELTTMDEYTALVSLVNDAKAMLANGEPTTDELYATMLAIKDQAYPLLDKALEVAVSFCDQYGYPDLKEELETAKLFLPNMSIDQLEASMMTLTEHAMPVLTEVVELLADYTSVINGWGLAEAVFNAEEALAGDNYLRVLAAVNDVANTFMSAAPDFVIEVEGAYDENYILAEELRAALDNAQAAIASTSILAVGEAIKELAKVYQRYVEANSAPVTVAAPTFSVKTGLYFEAQTVELSCETEDAQIYYTLDGTAPTEQSALYSEPLTISATTTVKAIAVLHDATGAPIATSREVEATYTILDPTVVNEDAPEKQAPEGWISAIRNGNLAGDDTGNYISKEAPSTSMKNAIIVPGAGANNSRGIVVQSADRTEIVDENGEPGWSGQDWETQFWIYLDEPLPLGTKMHVEFDYKASKDANAQTQSHLAPGDYNFWACIGDVYFTTEWQTYEADIVITSDMLGDKDVMQSIAFNLACEKSATTYFFDNFGVWVQKPITAAAPTFSVKPGFYIEAQTVELSCETEGAQIYYTLDGTDPTEQSTLYSEPFTLSETTTVKAIAILRDETGAPIATSDIASATYTIDTFIVVNEDDLEKQAPEGWISAIRNGNLAGDDTGNYISKEAPSQNTYNAIIVPGAGANHSRGIVVQSADRKEIVDNNGEPGWSGEDWETQFWIYLDEPLPLGTKMHVEFDYKASQDAAAQTQSHLAPGDYNFWQCIGDVYFTTEWQTYEADIVITSQLLGERDAMQSIAFNLACEKSATTYFFDNFGVWVQKPITVAAPTFSVKPGLYVEAQTVELLCETEGAQIYYTLDGTDPTEQSALYSEPLTISETTTVKAIAILCDATGAPISTSDIVSGTYTIDTSIVVNEDDPEKQAPEGWLSVIHNGNLAGDNVVNFVSKEAPSVDVVGATIIPGAGENNSRGIVVQSADRTEIVDENGEPGWSGQDWETQFWIYMDEPLPLNTKVHVEFDYRASKDANAQTQSHLAPGDYNFWACIGDVYFTTEWQTYEADIVITSDLLGDKDAMQSIAFNLACEKSATTYFFDNFGVWVQKPAPITNWTNIVENSDMEGENTECFYVTEQGLGGPYLAKFTEGIGVNGGKAVKVQSADNPKNNWDTQFFIRLPYILPAGTPFKLSFDYKADKYGDFETQCHNEPGQYIHYECVGTGTFSTDWDTYTYQGNVRSQCDGSMNQNGGYTNDFQTIAFNLSLNQNATQFIFDNVVLEIPTDILESLEKNPAVDPQPYPEPQGEEVTFNFNAATDHPVSNNSNEGDITEPLVLTEKGVTMTISPAVSGTPNRWWGTNNGPQVRMYSGTMTLEVPQAKAQGKAIVKVEINNGKWNAANTFNGETAQTGEWTGNSTNVVLVIAGNTQINKVVVTLADANDETTTYETNDDLAKALEDLNAEIVNATNVLEAAEGASDEAKSALLQAIADATDLYNKGIAGDDSVTTEAVEAMIDTLKNAVDDFNAIVVGIASVTVANQRDTIYTLNGQKVNAKLQKGVYIVNGKKVVVK